MLVARLFLISPIWVAYFCHAIYHGPLHEQMSFSTLLICSVVAFLVLCWWDSGRAPRSAISVIIRNMALAYCVVWSFLLLLLFGPVGSSDTCSRTPLLNGKEWPGDAVDNSLMEVSK